MGRGGVQAQWRGAVHAPHDLVHHSHRPLGTSLPSPSPPLSGSAARPPSQPLTPLQLTLPPVLPLSAAHCPPPLLPPTSRWCSCTKLLAATDTSAALTPSLPPPPHPVHFNRRCFCSRPPSQPRTPLRQGKLPSQPHLSAASRPPPPPSPHIPSPTRLFDSSRPPSTPLHQSKPRPPPSSKQRTAPPPLPLPHFPLLPGGAPAQNSCRSYRPLCARASRCCRRRRSSKWQRCPAVAHRGGEAAAGSSGQPVHRPR